MASEKEEAKVHTGDALRASLRSQREDVLKRVQTNGAVPEQAYAAAMIYVGDMIAMLTVQVARIGDRLEQIEGLMSERSS